MDVDYSGLHAEYATFKCTSRVTEVGQLVCMNDSDTVSISTAGYHPIGIVRALHDGYATVQIRGYMRVKHDGSVGIGYRHVVTLDDRTLKLDNTNGVMHQVVDATDDEVGIIF